ncbi:hypothetical protein [Bradyrhizobium lablabi]|uniref:ATP-dependent DNA ligase n=1 Tax=Bradyrhizobium lablabi TaxID=722472 RepID=UPI001FD9C954|nr:hypothetical protein [Bradyrhizobium lablabi]
MSAVAFQRGGHFFMSLRCVEAYSMPGFIRPQLATLKSKAPPGDQWLHEIKYDGYRVQVHANRGRKKVYIRSGVDWTKRFSSIAAALDIPARLALMGKSLWSMRGAPTSANCRRS